LVQRIEDEKGDRWGGDDRTGDPHPSPHLPPFPSGSPRRECHRTHRDAEGGDGVGAAAAGRGESWQSAARQRNPRVGMGKEFGRNGKQQVWVPGSGAGTWWGGGWEGARGSTPGGLVTGGSFTELRPPSPALGDKEPFGGGDLKAQPRCQMKDEGIAGEGKAPLPGPCNEQKTRDHREGSEEAPWAAAAATRPSVGRRGRSPGETTGRRARGPRPRHR